MQVIKKSLEGLVEIITTVYKDERGSFFETFNKEAFAANGLPTNFVITNLFKKGVVRGYTFSVRPMPKENSYGLL